MRLALFDLDDTLVDRTAARAWRWGPQMEEVADTLAAAGLPPEMLRAATLARWTDAKDDSELTLTDALNRLAHPWPAVMPSPLQPACAAAGR
jgi:FMN phosphatase YigB (HAD superfamily)